MLENGDSGWFSVDEYEHHIVMVDDEALKAHVDEVITGVIKNAACHCQPYIRYHEVNPQYQVDCFSL